MDSLQNEIQKFRIWLEQAWPAYAVSRETVSFTEPVPHKIKMFWTEVGWSPLFSPSLLHPANQLYQEDRKLEEEEVEIKKYVYESNQRELLTLLKTIDFQSIIQMPSAFRLVRVGRDPFGFMSSPASPEKSITFTDETIHKEDPPLLRVDLFDLDLTELDLTKREDINLILNPSCLIYDSPSYLQFVSDALIRLAVTHPESKKWVAGQMVVRSASPPENPFPLLSPDYLSYSSLHQFQDVLLVPHSLPYVFGSLHPPLEKTWPPYWVFDSFTQFISFFTQGEQKEILFHYIPSWRKEELLNLKNLSSLEHPIFSALKKFSFSWKFRATYQQTLPELCPYEDIYFIGYLEQWPVWFFFQKVQGILCNTAQVLVEPAHREEIKAHLQQAGFVVSE